MRNLTETYLEILREEHVARPKWVPNTITDGDVDMFVEMAEHAIEEGGDMSFSFRGHTFRVKPKAVREATEGPDPKDQEKLEPKVKGEKKFKDKHVVDGEDEEDVNGSKDGVDEESDDEYKKFFQKALDKWGVKSPDELDDAEKKKFFNWIDDNYKAKSEATDWSSDTGKKIVRIEPKLALDPKKVINNELYDVKKRFDQLYKSIVAGDDVSSKDLVGVINDLTKIDKKVEFFGDPEDIPAEYK